MQLRVDGRYKGRDCRWGLRFRYRDRDRGFRDRSHRDDDD